MNAREGLKNTVVGFIIGAASTLPGVSGGIIAVLFGIYERIIDDINDIIHKIKEDFWFLLTTGAGILIGMYLLMVLMKYSLDLFYVPTMFFFVGLILGQLPGVYKIAENGQPMKKSYIGWAVVGFVIMICLLVMDLILGNGTGVRVENVDLTTGIILALAVGAILSISKICPGVSGSAILLALGLYYWMLKMISDLELAWIIPFGIGFVIGVLIFSKIMGYLLKRFHSETYFTILGLTAGSIVVIFGMLFLTEGAPAINISNIAIGIVSLLVGVGVSIAFNRLGKGNKTSA